MDEWTLSENMASAGTLQSQLEDHYNTFIVRLIFSCAEFRMRRLIRTLSGAQTEQDIAQIAGAGLNWVRVPIPFWAIETWAGEPFLEKVCWK